MASKFNELPPAKRYRLRHEQENQTLTPSPASLPAKKRKESRSFPPELTPPSTTFCLPAKKRIWALQEFDLNLEFQTPVLPPPPATLCLPAKKRVLPLQEIDLNLEFQPPSASEKKYGEIANPMVEKLREQSEDEGDEEDDDGILCSICESTDGDPSDPIVFCDGCELMVHASCYGHPLSNGIPEGDWFCAECLSSKSPKARVNLKCSLCPVLGGALKPTTEEGKWAHVVCALLVPEVFFRDPEGREGIDMTQVPNRRWKHKCYICRSRNGCAIDCSEERCPLAFHVTCGIKKDLCIEYNEGRNKTDVVAGFCRTHSDLWRKQQNSGKYKIVAEK